MRRPAGDKRTSELQSLKELVQISTENERNEAEISDECKNIDGESPLRIHFLVLLLRKSLPTKNANRNITTKIASAIASISRSCGIPPMFPHTLIESFYSRSLNLFPSHLSQDVSVHHGRASS